MDFVCIMFNVLTDYFIVKYSFNILFIFILRYKLKF